MSLINGVQKPLFASYMIVYNKVKGGILMSTYGFDLSDFWNWLFGQNISKKNLYYGTVGNYTAAGDVEYARTSVQNPTDSRQYYSYYVYEYNWYTEKYEHSSCHGQAVPNGGTTEAAINGREISSGVVDYLHIVQGYASSVCISSAKVDDYTFRAMQYYR